MAAVRNSKKVNRGRRTLVAPLGVRRFLAYSRLSIRETIEGLESLTILRKPISKSLLMKVYGDKLEKQLLDE
jgi:hypothetical protein